MIISGSEQNQVYGTHTKIKLLTDFGFPQHQVIPKRSIYVVCRTDPHILTDPDLTFHFIALMASGYVVVSMAYYSHAMTSSRPSHSSHPRGARPAVAARLQATDRMVFSRSCTNAHVFT